jgi:hypothetical protein
VSSDSNNPKTGDAFDINLWTELLLTSGLGLAILIIFIKQKKQYR